MLTGKIALITGGTTGIGAQSTRLLAGAGAHVVVCSQLPVSEMERFCQEVRDEGGSVEAISCDVTDRAAVGSLIDGIGEAHDRLDILVNCAGVFARAPLVETSPETIALMFGVNIFGPIYLMQAALPLMLKGAGGSIINIASAAAVLGVEGCATYAATKAALVQFTKTLAPELKRTGIRVNAIAPGSVQTPMLGFASESLNETQKEMLAKRDAASTSPSGNAMLQPVDIADLVLFLASDASRALHGACLVADQGMTTVMSLPS